LKTPLLLTSCRRRNRSTLLSSSLRLYGSVGGQLSPGAGEKRCNTPLDAHEPLYYLPLCLGCGKVPQQCLMVPQLLHLPSENRRARPIVQEATAKRTSSRQSLNL